MKNKNLKSAIAFSLALCMLVPLTANMDSITDVLAIGDSTSSKTELTVGIDDNNSVYIQKGNLTSVDLVLTSEAWANANGVLSYWDNDLSELVTFPWTASFDENGTSTSLVENLPENIDTLYFQVYYSAYWDNNTSSMVDCTTTLSKAYAVEDTQETTTSESEVTTTPSVTENYIKYTTRRYFRLCLPTISSWSYFSMGK